MLNTRGQVQVTELRTPRIYSPDGDFQLSSSGDVRITVPGASTVMRADGDQGALIDTGDTALGIRTPDANITTDVFVADARDTVAYRTSDDSAGDSSALSLSRSAGSKVGTGTIAGNASDMVTDTARVKLTNTGPGDTTDASVLVSDSGRIEGRAAAQVFAVAGDPIIDISSSAATIHKDVHIQGTLNTISGTLHALDVEDPTIRLATKARRDTDIADGAGVGLAIQTVPSAAADTSFVSAFTAADGSPAFLDAQGVVDASRAQGTGLFNKEVLFNVNEGARTGGSRTNASRLDEPSWDIGGGALRLERAVPDVSTPGSLIKYEMDLRIADDGAFEIGRIETRLAWDAAARVYTPVSAPDFAIMQQSIVEESIRVSTLLVTWTPDTGILGPVALGQALGTGLLDATCRERLSFALMSAPDWLSITPTQDGTLVLEGVPPQEGTVQFELVATGRDSRHVRTFAVSLTTDDVRVQWNGPDLDLRSLFTDRGQLAVQVDATNPVGRTVSYTIADPSDHVQKGVSVDSGGQLVASRRIGLEGITVRARVATSETCFEEEDRTFAVLAADFLNTKRSRRTQPFAIEQANPELHPVTLHDSGAETQSMLAPTTGSRCGFDGVLATSSAGATIVTRFRKKSGTDGTIIKLGASARVVGLGSGVNAARLLTYEGQSGLTLDIATQSSRPETSSHWEVVCMSIGQNKAIASSNGSAAVTVSHLKATIPNVSSAKLHVGYDPSSETPVDVEMTHVLVHDTAMDADSVRGFAASVATGTSLADGAAPSAGPTTLSGPAWGSPPAALADHVAYTLSDPQTTLDIEARAYPLSVYVVCPTPSTAPGPEDAAAWSDVTGETVWASAGSRALPAKVLRLIADPESTRAINFGSWTLDAGTTLVASRSFQLEWTDATAVDMRPFYSADGTLARTLAVTGDFVGSAHFESDTPGVIVDPDGTVDTPGVVVDPDGTVRHTISTTAPRVRVIANAWRDGARTAIERSYDLLGLDTHALFSGAYGSQFVEWRAPAGLSEPQFLVDDDGTYLARFQNEHLSGGPLTVAASGASITIRMKRVLSGDAGYPIVIWDNLEGTTESTQEIILSFQNEGGQLWGRSGGDRIVRAFSPIVPDAWCVYTICATPATLKLWQDGELVASIDHATSRDTLQFDAMRIFNRLENNMPAAGDVSHVLLHDHNLSAAEVAALGAQFAVVWATQVVSPLAVARIGEPVAQRVHASVATSYEVVAGPGNWLTSFDVAFHRDDLERTVDSSSVYWAKNLKDSDLAWAAVSTGGLNRIYNNVTKRVFAVTAISDANGAYYRMTIRTFTRQDMNTDALRFSGATVQQPQEQKYNQAHTWYMWRGTNNFEIDVIGSRYEPPGLKLDPATGALSGTTGAHALNELTVRATSGSGASSDRIFKVHVIGNIYLESGSSGSIPLKVVKSDENSASPQMSTGTDGEMIAKFVDNLGKMDSIPLSPSPSLADGLTVSMRFFVTRMSYHSGLFRIMDTDGRRLLIRWAPGNVPKFYIHGTVFQTISPINIVYNTWYSLAFVFDPVGRKARVHVDGAVAEAPWRDTDIFLKDIGSMGFGYDGDAGAIFQGSASKLRVFNRPLTAEELAAL